MPFKDEFDSSAVIEAIWHAKKKCYLPVLTETTEPMLNFVPYRYGDALRLNRYKILEPVNIHTVYPANELDLVITPLIAFDDEGHRLGTGGGYYDRTFAFLRELMPRKPLLFGLAYAAQEAANIPSDSWDITLDGVITENKVIVF